MLKQKASQLAAGQGKDFNLQMADPFGGKPATRWFTVSSMVRKKMLSFQQLLNSGHRRHPTQYSTAVPSSVLTRLVSPTRAFPTEPLTCRENGLQEENSYGLHHIAVLHKHGWDRETASYDDWKEQVALLFP